MTTKKPIKKPAAETTTTPLGTGSISKTKRKAGQLLLGTIARQLGPTRQWMKDVGQRPARLTLLNGYKEKPTGHMAPEGLGGTTNNLPLSMTLMLAPILILCN